MGLKVTRELDYILKCCCDYLDINPDAAKVKCRLRPLVQARQLFCYFAKLKGHSHTTIGNHVNADHSTVSHCLQNVYNFISISDKKTLDAISNIEARIDDNSILLARLENDIKLLTPQNLIKFSMIIDKMIIELNTPKNENSN